MVVEDKGWFSFYFPGTCAIIVENVSVRNFYCTTPDRQGKYVLIAARTGRTANEKREML